MPDRLATTLCGIPLRNPVLAASGTFGYGIEFAKLVDLNQLGGLVTKGLSREPIAGNPAPRLWHTEGGMINSVGLQNVGVAAFIRSRPQVATPRASCTSPKRTKTQPRGFCACSMGGRFRQRTSHKR